MDPWSLVHECDINDINNMQTIRNSKRAERHIHNGDVSNDEVIMCNEDYNHWVDPSSLHPSPRAPAATPEGSPVNLPKSIPVTPCKYTFTDKDASKNLQAPMQNMIPNTLLEMFRVGA